MLKSIGDFSLVLLTVFFSCVAVTGCGSQSSPATSSSTNPSVAANSKTERANSRSAANTPEPNLVNTSGAKPVPSTQKVSGIDRPIPDVRQVAMQGEAGEANSEGEAAHTETESPITRHPLFEGWKKPELALFITGQQHGYIEPCGCAGLANQKGGLMRRQTCLNQLRNDRGWDVLAIDAGNQVRRFGRQAEIKFQTTASGLSKMDYEAVSFGPDDLRLSVDEVFAAVAEDPDNIKYVSSNASLLGFTPKHRVIEAAGKKIGITGVLGQKEQRRISNAEVEMSDPMEGLKKSWEALKAENCDLYILLCQASLDDSRKFAQAFPDFDIVVTAGGAGEPTLQPEIVEGTNTPMIQTGVKGMYVGVVGIFNDAANPLRYQRVPLDSRFADSDEMFKLLAAYQKQLETLGLSGLGIRPQPHPSHNQFVGSKACAECHEEAYEVWENSKHAHATETLIHPPERYQVSRHFDPECIACHVVGWNPELYVPFQSGYLSLDQTPQLQNVGCENCHGPGSAHVASQNGDGNFTDAQTEMLAQQMRLPLNSARDTCLKCHDLDNSPDFHVKGAFEKYWEEIKH